ncbi:TauD/TfdA family dioxygenase [Salinispora arenicola]|uniref:TauD/TfdA family dioxygenase n=1 Tax=Salinispora arenicola TaxID=168697 RepID=UPI000376D583|nr:TauD/TfdA family dioxygenase [Salinispora arenicola]
MTIAIPTSLHLTLDEPERNEIRTLAERLCQTRPALLDDPLWLAAAREYSCDLPVALRRALRRFSADSGREGAIQLHGLPSGSTHPTPTERESVERATTVPASASVMCAMALGEVVAFRAEKRGAVVHNVVPVPGEEGVQSNAGSRVMMEMHIENAFHPHRPDYVALACVRPDPTGSAGLRVASIRRALGLLSIDERIVLAEPRFRTEPPPSFTGGGCADLEPHPVFTGEYEDPDVKVDFNATESLDPSAGRVMASLREALEAVTDTVYFEPGDVVIVDNRVALHGRTAFEPRYDGHDRWLHRVFIQADGRRSRAMRPGGDHVID